MATATVLPVAFQQFNDEQGRPISGGKLYAFEAGLSSPLALYVDPQLTIRYTLPIVLDDAGTAPGPIYVLTQPAYKFRVDDANDVTQIGPIDCVIAYESAV